MRRNSAPMIAATLLAIALVPAACGSDGTPSPGAGDNERIEITMTDDLRFEPSNVQARQGDTVTFVVRNPTEVDHEFAVGNAETAGMMDGSPMPGSMGGMDHGMMGPSVPVPAGGTAKLSVTFTEAGAIPFACHLNAHDEAGMTGTITVT